MVDEIKNTKGIEETTQVLKAVHCLVKHTKAASEDGKIDKYDLLHLLDAISDYKIILEGIQDIEKVPEELEDLDEVELCELGKCLIPILKDVKEIVKNFKKK